MFLIFHPLPFWVVECGYLAGLPQGGGEGEAPVPLKFPLKFRVAGIPGPRGGPPPSPDPAPARPWGPTQASPGRPVGWLGRGPDLSVGKLSPVFLTPLSLELPLAHWEYAAMSFPSWCVFLYRQDDQGHLGVMVIVCSTHPRVFMNLATASCSLEILASGYKHNPSVLPDLYGLFLGLALPSC